MTTVFPGSVSTFFVNFWLLSIIVKLLTISTNLPCSKYVVNKIGQSTISVEKFNLDFTLNSQSSKVQNCLTQQSALLRLDSQSMKYLPRNIQRSANIEFFGEQPNSVIFLGKIHKYWTKNIGKFFLESVLSKKRHLSFCYIIHEMPVQVDFCYFCLCCFYISQNTSFESKQKTKSCEALIRELSPC